MLLIVTLPAERISFESDSNVSPSVAESRVESSFKSVKFNCEISDESSLCSIVADASKDSSSMSAASVAFASTAETALRENITKSTIRMVINIRLFKIIYSI